MAEAILKGCSSCGTDRPIFDFVADKRTSDRLSKCCRACAPVGNRALTVCGACGQRKELGKDCAPCDRRRKAAYKVRHAEKVKRASSVYKKALHASGADERAERRRLRKIASDQKRIAARREWKARNPGLVNASTAQRWAAKHRATPKWADRKAIERLYVEAAERGAHVDHAVPLRHPLVCGLHCEANLQLLTPFENMSKNNRYWPDMWEPVQVEERKKPQAQEWVRFAA